MFTAPEIMPGVPRPHGSVLAEPKDWTILSGLTHDLRQPLSIIDACADYLRLVLPPGDDRALDKIEMIQQQAAEANRLLRDALLKASYGEIRTEPAEASPAASQPLTKAASASVVY